MKAFIEAIGRLFSSDGFVPRRVCGLWPDWLVWEHIAGNALVGLAYVAMPLMIWRLGVHRPDWTPFKGVVRAFALFIGLCGLGHFLDMLAFFHPMYRLSGHVLIATGLVSGWTVWSLRQAWPALMAMRSPTELERMIAQRTEELTRALDELRLAEVDRASLATIVESSADAIMAKNLDGVVTSWNLGAERIFGYTSAEAVGRPMTFLFPRDRLDEESTILERLRRGERVDHFESVRLAKDGRSIDVSLTISPIKDRLGRIVGISKIARDITEKKRSVEALRESEGRLRHLNENLERLVRERTAELSQQARLIDQAHDAILVRSREGVISSWNQGAERIYGWVREEALGSVSHDLLKTRFPRPLAEIEEDLATLGSWEGELIHTTKDGVEVVVASRWIVDRDRSADAAVLEMNSDITERRASEEALRRSEAALRESQRLAGVGSWEWDTIADVVTWSDELYRIAGWGRSLPPPNFAERHQLYHQECLDLHDSMVLRTLETGEPYEIEVELIGGDGICRWIIGRGEAIRDSSGRVVKLRGTALDVTERREQREELHRALDQAVAATRAKGDFLANMSHEIRTPMNGVIGMTDLLLNSRLDDLQRDYAETIRSSGEALLIVINDILDLSKIEAGKLNLESTDFDLRALMEEVADLLVPSACRKNLKIHCRIASEVPRLLVGDPVRIRQVLTNLAGNAVKFTERGEVNLEARLLSDSSEGVDLRILVHDTGIGIPEDRQADIFESFVQIEGGISREYGGTGLGLTICRSLVALMGGRIGLESRPGKGSTFWFETRFAKEYGEANRSSLFHAQPPLADAEWTTLASPLHILLVEDNAINQEVAIGMVERLGCVVDAAWNGREALEALDYDRHDLVLMDVQMPEMDGLAATAAIRAQERGTGRHIPIIAMTAHAMEGDRERCLAGGMDGYVSKPIRPGLLREALNAWPGKTERPPTEPGQRQTRELPTSFADGIRASCGDDPKLIRKVLELMLQSVPVRLKRLETAVVVGDRRRVSEEAHSLTGAFATVGAEALATACQELMSIGEGDDSAAIEKVHRRVRTQWEGLQKEAGHYLASLPD